MKKIIGHCLSAVLGGLFFYAGFIKLADKPGFFEAVRNYQLVGDDAAWALALILPWMEIVAGLALISPRFRWGGLAWLVLMLIGFEVGLASAWARGLDIDCGCFGGESTSAQFAFFRNGFLLAILGVIAWTQQSTKPPAQ